MVRIDLATRPSLPITRPRSAVGNLDLEDQFIALVELLDLDGVRLFDDRADQILDKLGRGRGHDF